MILLFAYETYDPYGGGRDLVGRFDTIEEVIDWLDRTPNNDGCLFDNVDAFDLDTLLDQIDRGPYERDTVERWEARDDHFIVTSEWELDERLTITRDSFRYWHPVAETETIET